MDIRLPVSGIGIPTLKDNSVEITFKDGKLHFVGHYDGDVPIRTTWHIIGAIAEKIKELEERYKSKHFYPTSDKSTSQPRKKNFGLCLYCKYSSNYLERYRCSHPEIGIDSYVFLADHGCNYFKSIPAPKKEGKPAPSPVLFTESLCRGCDWISPLGTPIGCKNVLYDYRWEFPSKSCQFFSKNENRWRI